MSVDSIREYLTGAAADGDTQAEANLSLGNYRSSWEASSRSIRLSNMFAGFQVDYVGGSNPIGAGMLFPVAKNGKYSCLAWQPPGDLLPGTPVLFPLETTTLTVKSLNDPGKYLRITGRATFGTKPVIVAVSSQHNNVFGFGNVLSVDASSGKNNYRATIIRNETNNSISKFKRIVAELGATRISDSGQLGSSGSGTVATTGSFASWPSQGWCRIEQNDGTLREIVYYPSRNTTTLNIPSTGRHRLGTSSSAGASDDILHSVPGVLLGLDTNGLQSFGNPILTIANENTAPAGVTFDNSISISTIDSSKQIGIWMWREMPANTLFYPDVSNPFTTSFQTY